MTVLSFFVLMRACVRVVACVFACMLDSVEGSHRVLVSSLARNSARFHIASTV